MKNSTKMVLALAVLAGASSSAFAFATTNFLNYTDKKVSITYEYCDANGITCKSADAAAIVNGPGVYTAKPPTIVTQNPNNYPRIKVQSIQPIDGTMPPTVFTDTFSKCNQATYQAGINNLSFGMYPDLTRFTCKTLSAAK